MPLLCARARLATIVHGTARQCVALSNKSSGRTPVK